MATENNYQISSFFSNLLKSVANRGLLVLFSAQADTNQLMIEQIDLKDEDCLENITETIDSWSDKVGFNIYYPIAIRDYGLKKNERGGLGQITSALGFVVDCDKF